MSPLDSARTAYARPDAPLRTPRSLEYDLLARMTQRMTATATRRDTDFPAFAGALHDNLRLWSTLAADVAGSGNGLPPKLRAQLFYLYQFTAAHSAKVLETSADIEVLVDINTAVMRGLRGDGRRG
ncbi:flagellar biosynthesis regulator FlaF [Fertoebacter nigrum]|uniref:Flagellar biosynthesis regulator FlaF n=1 Tax=Fertoeibacter niger TaxID=2656921 RepID=A0A8X8KNE6_9RHOB|nr:flagellar biosynthesis regulator FlaF [Fertoeibacter niger]NUB44915.1 flagellar biosynthesis regulator FlaF [Fertoeibacter niger]